MTKTKQIAYLMARLTQLIKIENSGKVADMQLTHDTHVMLNAKISEIVNTLSEFYNIDVSDLVEMSFEIKGSN